MIRRQDILDRAAEWGLRPDVVEKDYVLGWLLAAIALEPTMRSWVFKGGTCIKKCYFETYRFSEDLDFSLLPEAPYTETAVRDALVAVATLASKLSGIAFPAEYVTVRVRQNQQKQPTFQGRIGYQGPLRIHNYPRVLFDITCHEPVVDAAAQRAIFHPYPDALPEGVDVSTYSFDELLAEKTRALYERSRPRDLYDVVFLLENHSGVIDLSHARYVFQKKCEAKRLGSISTQEIIRVVSDDAELRSEWKNMLAHQLPQLPRLDDFLARLGPLLVWIDEPERVAMAPLPQTPLKPDEHTIAPAGIHFWGGGQRLETIRFAGTNRLLIEFMYNGKHRRVEPYSIRRAGTGNLLLYGWELGSTHIKAFKVTEMQAIRTTNVSFSPRYSIEFTAHDPVNAPLVSPNTRTVAPKPRSRHSARRRYGLTYVYECTHCGKRFRHTKSGATLRKHKAKGGNWDCPGRTGYLVDTTWH